MKHKHIEGTGKPLKVVAPVSGWDITEGKEYTVTDADNGIGPAGWGFYFNDDDNFPRYSIEFGAISINGGNWIVTEREATANTD